MSLTIYPVTSSFAAEVGDVDLARLRDGQFEAICDAFWRYGVLIFPEQAWSGEEQLAFARRFGTPDPPFGRGTGGRSRLVPGLIDVSNMAGDGRLWAEESRIRLLREGDRHWHTDSSFNHVPALVSILFGRSVPPVGGLTEFADGRAAYDALPEVMRRRLDGLVAEHSWFTSRDRYGVTDFPAEWTQNHPPVAQLLVRTLPETGRRSLFLASHAGRIFGMEPAEGRALIDALIGHATQPQFIYRHRWRAGDVVMWDNRCTMHRGTRYDDTRWPRDFQRATVSDRANTLVQEGVPVPADREAEVPAA